MRRNKVLNVALILLVILLLGACSSKDKSTKIEQISETKFLLGTVVDIKIFGNGNKDILDKAFNRLEEIENKMTINKEKSEVIKVNEEAGKEEVEVSADTFYVIDRAKYFSEISEARFDVTIGPLVKSWNIGMEGAKVPSLEEIERNKSLVNYEDLILDKENKTVHLKKEGMILDLGGIAKGYGADEVVNILKENGVKHAIINLGGNVYAHGTKYNGEPWKIGVQNPLSPRGSHIGIVKVSDETVVTSGIYERYLEEDGKVYHHIIDPKTGYPVENNVLGVSIIAQNSIDGDGLSTAVFSLGVEKGMDFIENFSGVEGIFITKDKEVYASSGIKDRFELTDEEFKLK